MEATSQGKRGRDATLRDEPKESQKRLDATSPNASVGRDRKGGRGSLKRKASLSKESEERHTSPSTRKTPSTSNVKTKMLAVDQADDRDENVPSTKELPALNIVSLTPRKGRSNTKKSQPGLPAAFFDEDLASSSDEEFPDKKATSVRTGPTKAAKDKTVSTKANGRKGAKASAAVSNGLESQARGTRNSNDSFDSPTKKTEVIVEVTTPTKSKPKPRKSGVNEREPGSSKQSLVESEAINFDAIATRNPSRRQAASRASEKLHENAIDMIKYEHQKRSHNYRGEWEEKNVGKEKDDSEDKPKKRRSPSAMDAGSGDEETGQRSKKKTKVDIPTQTKSGRQSATQARKKSAVSNLDDDEGASQQSRSGNSVDPNEICVLTTQVVLSDSILKVCEVI
jgi:hypothetical protein